LPREPRAPFGALLAWSAINRIGGELNLEEFLNQHQLVVRALYTLVIGGVLHSGYAVNGRKERAGSAMQTQLPD